MEVKAIGKFVSVSPKKAREIAGLVRGKGAKEASELIRFMPGASAAQVGKVLASAMANAENNFNLDKNELSISQITVDGGPVVKRYRPRARGAAGSILRKTSHITVVVAGEVKTKKSAESSKSEKAMPQKSEEMPKPESLEGQAEEHKIEVERPDFGGKNQAAQKFDIKNKIFRRKTG